MPKNRDISSIISRSSFTASYDKLLYYIDINKTEFEIDANIFPIYLIQTKYSMEIQISWGYLLPTIRAATSSMMQCRFRKFINMQDFSLNGNFRSRY